MTKYIFVLLGLFSSTLLFPQSVSEVAAVQLSAVASASPVRITVSWKSLSGTNSITIYRKLKSATSWGSSIASPSPTTNSYIDNGVSVGIAYEYKVVRVANGVTGTGYLCSGINVPMRDYRGKIILLVANNLSSPLSTELLTLEKDLAADGWAVLRTDVTTNTTVSGVRNIIIGQYQSDPTNVKAVYIVGHLAVPYSGNIAPDGHDSHQGAWPCDGYYGEMNGNWTDNSVSVQASQNPKNFNVPGDGKFDQSDFPSALELQVGRVDLYDMPAFSSSEVELTRNYLNKAHTFKVKGYTPDPRAMMFDNLQWVGNPLAASGWRSIAPMVGAEEISAPYQYGPSYNSLVNGQSYLWAYASGGGLQEYIGNEVTFNGADNIGTTQTYAAGNLGGVFNMSFGSYFGDWDNKNNFLRAPLAKGEGLTNAYSSIPGWYFHHMGLGENIGYSTLETMNNTGLYVPLTDGWQGSIGRTHLGLMGDPSLRQKMVAPPTSLSISNSGGSAVFSWTASSEQIAGYYIYQFDATTGAISKVTNTLVTSTSYQNSSVPFQNGKQYMVRAMKMQVDPSGSYENLSLGTIAVSSGVAPPPTTDCEGVVGGTAVAGTTCNDGNSCTTNDRWNSSCQCIGIDNTPTASVTPVGSTTFCTGGNVVLNASTGSSYQWKKDGNAISGATSSSYTATTSGTYTVTVSNGSCSATSSGVSVSASSGPSANITAPNGTTFCSGGSAILNATTGTGFQYVWYRNGNAISGATNSNYTATQAGAYTVRVISGTCYTNSSAISIEVSTSITAVITPNGPTTFCTGGSVVLNATSDGTHVWQFNGQAIPGATSSSYTATQQGSYKVIVTNGSCSATSDAVTVSISTSAPAATLSASGPVNLCVGSSVVLSAPPGSSYVWEHNNEAINGATNSNYTVTQGGSYSVTVGTGACASTSDPLNVTVNTPPPAIISATGPTTVCAGQSVALTANTGSGYQFVWKRNGSPISGATSSSYTATQPGNYAVMVIHGACYTNSAETAISMSGTGSASISPAGPTTFCTGGNVILNANAGSIYQWMRNGETIDGATSSNYTATQEGSYTVTVGSGSCAGTSSPLMVSVSSVISASITPAGPTTFCTGGNVVLNANAGSIYQWMRNGETIDGATSSNYSATQEGSYTVTVGSGSCTGTSSAVTVSVTSIGSATIAPGGSTSFCTGGSVILYANTGAGYSYVWRKNGTVINGATASNYTATEVGSYTVAVNAGTCSATSSAIIVTVTNNISATLFATGPVGFCYGGSVVLAVDGDAGYTYVWKLNGSTIQGATSNSFTGTQAGIYTVVVSNGNCSATSNSVQLHVGDQINTNITATQQTDLCSNGGVTLSVPAASGNTYIWRNYGAAINGATSNTYTAASSGGYEVSIYNGSCVANSNVVFVNAGSGVNTWIMALGNTHVCSGDEVVFSTYTLAGLSHTWRRNGATINGATGSTYTATQNGSYSVTTSNGSCTVTTNAIQAYISAPLAVTCSPNVGNGTIAANVTGGEAPYNYLWNTAPAQITQMAAIDVSGMYNVIVTDVNGCTVNANASIEIGSGMAVEETEDVLAETIVKDEASENIEILVYPNPFRGNTTFSITGLNAEERTTLDVYTIDGVLVANVFTGAVDQQGSYRLTWDASNLKTGMYFYRLISGGRVTSGKLKSE